MQLHGDKSRRYKSEGADMVVAGFMFTVEEVPMTTGV